MPFGEALPGVSMAGWKKWEEKRNKEKNV